MSDDAFHEGLLDASADSPVLTDEVEDDDPLCTNCGIYRSEHGMAQCDGFTTKPGGFIVYTSSDLEEMSWEEKADLFGWDDREFDPEEDDPDEVEGKYEYEGNEMISIDD